MKKKYCHLFGPVPSRRFGRSLGVDLTPYKTCTLDCIFCQLGRTTNKTVEREEFVLTVDVLDELKDWLRVNRNADYITLSGSGEPTLHSRFGEVLEFVHANSQIPAVLLSNGTMFHMPEVRAAAAYADIVKVSLSAWDQASYEQVNRPHPQMLFDHLIQGQKALRSQFSGQLWMEVFVVNGINSTPSDVRKIAALAKEIGPDRIQLNTAVRPPSEDFVVALSKKRMEALTHLFHPTAEIIAEFNTTHAKSIQANHDTILSMLRRRPCTAGDIANIFDMHLNEVSKYLGKLIRTNQIRSDFKNGVVYYWAESKAMKTRS
ncbi:MAG: radical SAM protein [Thermodesulfobacteriota bacterium]|nr:radical SAM protein [Thermodesulfobacteriota bacterium]